MYFFHYYISFHVQIKGFFWHIDENLKNHRKFKILLELRKKIWYDNIRAAKTNDRERGI